MATPRRASLLALCRALPGVTEDVKWSNDLVFYVGGKMFTSFDAKASDARFSCRVQASDIAAVTSLPGIQAARVGARDGWIEVVDPRALLAGEAAALIRASYDLVKSKLPVTAQREIGGPAARRRVPKRLARARPAVKLPVPKKPTSLPKRPNAADTPWAPIAPAAPRVPARKPPQKPLPPKSKRPTTKGPASKR